MTQFIIPNRPFASEPITGLMTPDGIFEVSLGKQMIHAHFMNNGPAIDQVQIYIESVSDPGIVVTPRTYKIDHAATGVSHLFSWEADFSAATPGKHMVSFIVITAAGLQRIIKTIFLTKMSFNPATHSFSVMTPEAVFNVAFKKMIGPRDPHCSNKKNTQGDEKATLLEVLNGVGNSRANDDESENLLDYLSKAISVTNDPRFKLCVPQLLLGELEAQLQLTPPSEGQYGDLPFQDPWWKVVLAVVAFVLLVAAAIAEAVDGSGDITAGAGGTHDLPNDSGGSCCTIEASGGGTSKVAAGLVAAAATVATIAGASDTRDPFRKGQDHTAPNAGELTVTEEMKMSFSYPEAIMPGKPFKVKVDWKYQRNTTGGTYTYNDIETNANTHLLSKYEMSAPDVIHLDNDEKFIVKAQFYDADHNLFTGNQLFVQCFLIGLDGQWNSFVLQDTGIDKDETVNDGTYTGSKYFSRKDNGIWKYLVIAQDINHATPDMEPEEAAQIIGGMLLTNQLSISFEGGTCPIVYDGEVNVIG
ncbi:hypothetical protein H1Z61_08760 [Bacillus aquiflavi]|uniref:Uncharacterized protein n=1 Tax=Bacillus aquiflavi TaxID=2672567 RepID=A0A6B3VW73_9BACI|nr:hypothetical protein [Bacillus aquiflavi]MBA4537231.1 hypothetical protein [Bacillus aquiflavi]NEY81488.1 hypothetical protein [Bacillus aquiflavi]